MRSDRITAALVTMMTALLISGASYAGQANASQVATAKHNPAIAQQSAAVAPAKAPREAVETLHGTLLKVMQQAGKLGFEGRRSILAGVVPSVFNIPGMARISTGDFWDAMTPDDRERMTDAFKRFTVATYADRFDGYKGEKFVTIDEQPGPKGTVFVKTHIVKSDGEAVKLTYLTRAFDGKWQIIDIFFKGSLSELATKRSEYTSMIKKAGLDGLIHEIDAKIQTMTARP